MADPVILLPMVYERSRALGRWVPLMLFSHRDAAQKFVEEDKQGGLEMRLVTIHQLRTEIGALDLQFAENFASWIERLDAFKAKT